MQRALYREPELKVADLAAAMGGAEQKVSRAITQGLGERNLNQWVNRQRVAHACRLLEADDARSVLEISLDSGFASSGPSKRAFKAVTGSPPTAWLGSATSPLAGANPPGRLRRAVMATGAGNAAAPSEPRNPARIRAAARIRPPGRT